jgi:hypothetical protein
MITIMRYLSILFAMVAEFGVDAAGLKPRASLPPTYTVQDLGLSQNPGFPNLYRDGGGGAKINGVNIIAFSDSFVTDGAPTGNLKTFVSNTFAYTGYVFQLRVFKRRLPKYSTKLYFVGRPTGSNYIDEFWLKWTAKPRYPIHGQRNTTVWLRR